MTIPSLTGLDTALRGLTAAQAAIDTTGQNIANANNPGYSRQRVNLSQSPPISLPMGGGNPIQLGTGVDVTSITRIRDQFLDVQYRAQNSTTNNLATANGLLSQVQTTLAEPSSSGISEQLTKFWNSWSDLANAPSSAAAQASVVQAGETLSSTFNTVNGQLQALQGQASSQLTSLTGASGPIQSDANQIATLNVQINRAMQGGQTPNSLLDQRDQLLDNLSQYGNVSVSDPGNGLLTVNFGGDSTTPLVGGATANSVSSLTLGATSGGSVGALSSLSSPTGPIGGYLSTLNSFATSLAGSVNAIHTTPAFFTVAAGSSSLGSTATTLAVNPSLVSSPSGVQRTSTSNPGANDVALAVASLAGGTPDQKYTTFVAQVGADVKNGQSSQTTAQSVLTAVGNQRQSASGVSLDEEMTNLITYQRAYQASARVMSTIDSMLDTLINRTGL